MSTPRNRPAPLVVLEGIDGSGKGTQAVAVSAQLQAEGLRVETFSFPRYSNTFFGQRIGDFLNGRFGTLAAVDPFLVSLLYAGDRYESRAALLQAQESADIVLLDRYVPSNIAHQSSKLPAAQQGELRNWIEHVEYDLFGLPRPELILLLQLPVSAATELISRKSARDYTSRKADLQEADATYLQYVSDCYTALSREEPWYVVPVTEQGTYRPVENITNEIVQLIHTKLSVADPQK